MSHGQQFTLYSNQGGPNGWCVRDRVDWVRLLCEIC